MSQHQRFSRNAPCPCGSGKKYKHCCLDKSFDWLADDQNKPVRAVPFSDEIRSLLEGQRQELQQSLGRPLEPDDLLFANAPPAEQVQQELIEAMKRGLDPALIHAFEKTGLLVSEENQHLIPERDLQRWAAAVAEYNQRHNPPRYPLATVALYGLDDRTPTKVAVGIFVRADAKPIVRRWVGLRVMEQPRTQRQIEEFLKEQGVATVVQHPEILGCPHEEGEDFPLGQDCPFCPFWKGKQGSNRRT